MKKNICAILSLILIMTSLFITPAFAATTPKEDEFKIVTDHSLYTVQVNEAAIIQASLVPAVGNTVLLFKSAAPNIATVDNNGRVVGVQPGTTTITISDFGGKAQTEVYVTVKPILVTEITSSASRTVLYSGETAEITTYFIPVNASRQKVKYESSNPGVIYVDSDGKVLAAGHGTATVTITAIDDENVFTKIDFIVKMVPYFNVKLPAEMSINETAEITISAKDSLVYTITHTSSNPDVLTINEDGTVSSLSEGKAVVTSTVTLSDGYVITVTNTVVVDDPDTAPRCAMCDAYEASIGTPTEIIFKIFHTIVHFLSELFAG